MRSLVAGVASGVVLVFAFPPYNWGILVLPALVLLLWALRTAPRPAWAAATGLTFGVVFFGLLFPWLAQLGLVALIPLVLVESLYPAAYGWLVRRATAWSDGRWWVVAVGGWGAMEWVRDRFPVGGFGWGLAGYPVGNYAGPRGAAQWIGTSGWSVVLVAVAAGFVLIRRRRGWVWAAAATVIAAGLALAGWRWPAVADGRPVRVAIVQGNMPCPGSTCPDPRLRTYESHLQLTRSIPAGSVDLVVWPEGSTGSFDADPELTPGVAAAMGAEARRIGAVLLAGGDRPISDTEWVNANVVFDTQGKIVGEYRKRHPVPFGEYIPLRSVFTKLVPALSAVPRDMVRGAGPKVFDLDFGPFGSVISFESAFARYSRQTVDAGARLLVIATSQASYPLSNASDQLIGITRMRSAELGVDVVHAAVTGRSVLITHGGVTGPRTGLLTATLLTGTVHMRASGPTLYALWGDWLQVAAAVAMFVAVAGPAVASRVRRDT